METERKKEKMKTSDKIITTLLLLAIIVGGGYFVCKHFGIISSQSIIAEETEGIETIEIWNRSWYGGMDSFEQFEYIVPYLERSSATYFTGQYIPEGENADFQYVIQTNKENFENIVTEATIEEMTKGIAEDIEKDLNRDFTCSVDKEYEELEYVFQVYHFDLEYLIENEVKLKCDNIKINKICAANDNGSPVSVTRIISIGTMDVTTVESNGDMSNTVFGDAGETVTIKFAILGGGTRFQGYDGYLNDVRLSR